MNIINDKTLIVFYFVFLCFNCTKKKKDCVPIKTPPFDGTIFIDPDIITSKDPSAFLKLKYFGKDTRIMYDRRVEDWVTIKPYLFLASYDDSLQIEIQVNPEFGNDLEAKIQAEKFAPIIGHLPNELRKDVETVWIHKGLKPFGGGNNNLLIHTGWSSKYYESQGILEETFIHEASHTSLDNDHAMHPNWIKAQNKDCGFISTYAQENPKREDISESYLPYFAIRYKKDRISKTLKDSIEKTIPNRIQYFDSMNFKMHPVY